MEKKTNIYYTINLTKRNTKNLSIVCIFGIGHSCYGQLTAGQNHVITSHAQVSHVFLGN